MLGSRKKKVSKWIEFHQRLHLCVEKELVTDRSFLNQPLIVTLFGLLPTLSLMIDLFVYFFYSFLIDHPRAFIHDWTTFQSITGLYFLLRIFDFQPCLSISHKYFSFLGQL